MTDVAESGVAVGLLLRLPARVPFQVTEEACPRTFAAAFLRRTAPPAFHG
jgi:hypothetical protein